MKILIVDDYPETKCFGIIQECKKRDIDVLIERAISPALQRIFLSKDQINGIILDMGLPVYENGRIESQNEGESVLRELERKKREIPVLVFSETNLTKTYKPVFDIMKNWNIMEEEKKFFNFLDYLEEKSN